MRAHQLIQITYGDTIRMQTDQAENQLDGTVLLGKFSTVRHDLHLLASSGSVEGGILGVWDAVILLQNGNQFRQGFYQSQFLRSSIAPEPAQRLKICACPDGLRIQIFLFTGPVYGCYKTAGSGLASRVNGWVE
jgi:hypothetical protein